MTPEELEQEVRRIELGSRRLVRDLAAGAYASSFRGRGLEFADVREYHPGDDIRAIDWRVTARLGTTHVRQYQEERELTVVLLVDASPSGDVGTTLRTRRELATELAAVLALTAARSNDRAGLVLFTDRIERVLAPRKGRRHALRVVAELLGARPEGGGTDVAAALSAAEPLVPRRAIVFVLSDFEAPGFGVPLARLARRHEVIAVQLVDRLEAGLPPVGLVDLYDPERGSWLTVDASHPAVRAHLAAARRERDQQVEREVLGAGAELLRLDAAEPYADPVLAFFRRRAARRTA